MVLCSACGMAAVLALTVLQMNTELPTKSSSSIQQFAKQSLEEAMQLLLRSRASRQCPATGHHTLHAHCCTLQMPLLYTFLC